MQVSCWFKKKNYNCFILRRDATYSTAKKIWVTLILWSKLSQHDIQLLYIFEFMILSFAYIYWINKTVVLRESEVIKVPLNKILFGNIESIFKDLDQCLPDLDIFLVCQFYLHDILLCVCLVASCATHFRDLISLSVTIE